MWDDWICQLCDIAYLILGVVDREFLSHYWCIWTGLLFLQSNNDILLSTFTHTIPPFVTMDIDNAEDVQRKALDYFKASTFTSYTELRPEGSMVSLVLGKKDNSAGKTMKGKVVFNFEAFTTKKVDEVPQKPRMVLLHNAKIWRVMTAVIFLIIIITFDVLFYTHNVLCCNLYDLWILFAVLFQILCMSLFC